MQMISEPTIDSRPEQPYVGIRLWIPTKDPSTWTTNVAIKVLD
jgi:hypothetical protein